jgi:4-alpha-glucanotransferase
MPDSVAVALHRLVARTPARLLAAAIEDLTGSSEQVNVPGTTHEHPNWQRKVAFDLDALPSHPLFRAITSALREERPKP